MITLHSRRFQLVWATWTLILGVSLVFVHTIHYVHSFPEYLQAFLNLDMPASWCPTFLILYGIAVLAAYSMNNSMLMKLFISIARLAGFMLLPIGIYAMYTFTLESTLALDFTYIYAQTIHVSEILTGLFTAYLLTGPKKQVPVH